MNLAELYDATSIHYTKGEVMIAPPQGYDMTGLPPRPSPDQVRDIGVNIHNLEAEIEAATTERAKAQEHLLALGEKQTAQADDVEIKAQAAELAALDAEAQMMGDAFPADREKRRAELRKRLETDPSRQATVLQVAIQHHEGRIREAQGRLQFERERLRKLQEAEQAHKEREVVAAAQRRYWGVETPNDVRLLREAGVDLDSIPRRVGPMR